MAITAEQETELLSSFAEGWKAPDFREIYLWASDHVNLGTSYAVPGRFDVSRSKYLIEPFKALKDIRCRQVAVMAPPRSGKTLLGEVFLLHTIANNAGPFLWLQSSGKTADKMSDLRMVGLLRNCEPVRGLIDGNDKFAITKDRFRFPHMQVHVDSAKIRALQSVGYKFIVFDEVWLAARDHPGFIGEAQARQGDFKAVSKMLLLSQGGTEGDDWTNEFNRGLIYEWAWLCPSCQKEQLFHWNKQREDGTYGGIVWDKNEKTKPNGAWNYSKAAETARIECLFCRHQVADNPQNRRYLNDTGRYLLTNLNGDPKKKSFRWNALANIDVSFADLTVEYLQAKDTLAQWGNKTAIEEFHQKRLAKSFDKSFQPILSKIPLADYNPVETWNDEAYRFMTIDCQHSFAEFWYVIRAWTKTADSRLIKWGKASTFDELAQIQKENNVRDWCVFIDSGYRATQVYAEQIKRGHWGIISKARGKEWLNWVSLKGWDAKDFQWPDNTKKLYSPPIKGDHNLGIEAKGKTAWMYRWSGSSIKSSLAHLRDGKAKVKWLTSEYDADYERQMNSEILQRVIDKKGQEKWEWLAKTGVPNHIWDCECMQLVAAYMRGIAGQI